MLLEPFSIIPLLGFMTKRLKKIIFLRRNSDVTAIQAYTGYSYLSGDADERQSLSGVFEAFSANGGGNQHQNSFGWTADIPLP
jgi:hypothetical protein